MARPQKSNLRPVRIPGRLFRASLVLPEGGSGKRAWRWRRAALVAVQHAAERHLIQRLGEAITREHLDELFPVLGSGTERRPCDLATRRL